MHQIRQLWCPLAGYTPAFPSVFLSKRFLFVFACWRFQEMPTIETVVDVHCTHSIKDQIRTVGGGFLCLPFLTFGPAQQVAALRILLSLLEQVPNTRCCSLSIAKPVSFPTESRQPTRLPSGSWFSGHWSSALTTRPSLHDSISCHPKGTRCNLVNITFPRALY